MKTIHRISIRTDDVIRRTLADIGVNVPDGLVTFEIDESDPRWPRVAEFVQQYRAVDVPRTKATPQERGAAARLQLKPGWHHGYPQPEADAEYLRVTYDLSDNCPNCGIGARQTAPFRMVGEPKWGGRSILQLNWVFDEFFVTPEIWQTVFQPYGVAQREVLNYRSGKRLTTVVQLTGAPIAESGLDLKQHSYKICPRCERRRYLPISRGCFPNFAQPVIGDWLKTKEYFGDGAVAHRGVIISQALHQAMVRGEVKGCDFLPLCQ